MHDILKKLNSYSSIFFWGLKKDKLICVSTIQETCFKFELTAQRSVFHSIAVSVTDSERDITPILLPRPSLWQAGQFKN